jgi:2-amino-1-hydroxyethylphosphonate dioxygenase (glycine-forming)
MDEPADAKAGEVSAEDKVFLAKHDTIGASYLRELGFPERVARLVEGHVAAKRYLCFKKKGYFEGLSEGSVFTLKHQGGIMTSSEAKKFEQDPDFSFMVKMRHWDEAAKVVGLKLPTPNDSFKGYSDRIQKVLASAFSKE